MRLPWASRLYFWLDTPMITWGVSPALVSLMPCRLICQLPSYFATGVEYDIGGYESQLTFWGYNTSELVRCVT